MNSAHGLLHAYSDLSHYERTGSRVVARGDGIFVYDEQGHEYIEGVAGLWCTSFGFGERELVEAAHHQLQRLPAYHIAAGRTSSIAIELADRLLQIAPGQPARVFFTNSGSEANDTQIKLLWLYNNICGHPKKKKVISRRHAYHGATIASASLTGIESNHVNFDLPQSYVLHASAPRYWADALDGENEDEYATRLAAELDRMIEEEGSENIAAFIAEPVMAAGGVLIPPATYFAKVQEVLSRHDVRFIVDEVICGFGRLGEMWGCEAFDLHPAGISCAKALTSGYMPMGAVLIDQAMHEALRSESDRVGGFNHGFTFSGHPVAAAVALRTLELIEEREIIAHVQRVAPRFREAIEKLSDHRAVRRTSVIGLLAGVELTSPAARATVETAESHGLFVRALGPATIALCPPLIIDEGGIDAVGARLQVSLPEH